MLKVENLKKVFRTEEIETIALNGVSFEVNEGEFVAVMGPSGCGKSTLLNILGLLDNPTSGEYYLIDREVGQLRERDRTKFRKGNIGFVFQSFNLIDELNVAENVELPLIYLGGKSSERKERVKKILDRMNISHRADHFPQQLSGGQQQRVAIARALVANPKLILADEPTGNLERSGGYAAVAGAQPRGYHGDHGDALAARRVVCLAYALPLRRRACDRRAQPPVNDVSGCRLPVLMRGQRGLSCAGAVRHDSVRARIVHGPCRGRIACRRAARNPMK